MKNGLPEAFDQRLVEAHAAVVQLVGGGALDAALEQLPLGGAAALEHRLLEPVARLEQGRRLDRQAQPIRLQQALGRGQHGRELPAVARLLARPAFVGDARQHGLQLGRRQAVAAAQPRLGEAVGQLAAQPVLGDPEVAAR